MKATRGRYGTSYPTLKEGDQVWLDGKNLKIWYPKIKLAPKRYSPFPITKVLGPVDVIAAFIAMELVRYLPFITLYLMHFLLCAI
jgi:hypothetical protein